MLLPNPDFLKWFLDAVTKARKSVVVVNYLATLREGEKGAVAKVATALVSAIKRGVEVQVVLEGNKLGENYLFWRVLKDAGADCWMDTSVTFIHTKAILIDDKTLCIGSHNITAAALVYHEEISLTTTDPNAIICFKKELAKYTEQRRTIGDAPKEGVLLPATIMEPLVRIKRRFWPDMYFVYLFLWRLNKGRRNKISVDAASWVRDLNLPKSNEPDEKRIARILDFLDSKFKLIRFDKGLVSLNPLKTSKQEILLPDCFWNYGWHRRLSVGAIQHYLGGECERIISPNNPWWRLKRDQIAARYGFQKQLVNRAQRELMRYDLLEVLYETSSSPYREHIRYMNYFRQNPFYDYEKRMAQIAALKGRYSKEVFGTAEKIVQKLSIDSDAERLEALCRHVAESGIKKGLAVLRAISNLKPFSSRRTFDYAIELFEVKG